MNSNSGRAASTHRTRRFWNECIQTFVTENGHFTMRFYDPYTLDEIPVD